MEFINIKNDPSNMDLIFEKLGYLLQSRNITPSDDLKSFIHHSTDFLDWCSFPNKGEIDIMFFNHSKFIEKYRLTRFGSNSLIFLSSLSNGRVADYLGDSGNCCFLLRNKNDSTICEKWIMDRNGMYDEVFNIEQAQITTRIYSLGKVIDGYRISDERYRALDDDLTAPIRKAGVKPNYIVETRAEQDKCTITLNDLSSVTVTPYSFPMEPGISIYDIYTKFMNDIIEPYRISACEVEKQKRV